MARDRRASRGSHLLGAIIYGGICGVIVSFWFAGDLYGIIGTGCVWAVGTTVSFFRDRDNAMPKPFYARGWNELRLGYFGVAAKICVIGMLAAVSLQKATDPIVAFILAFALLITAILLVAIGAALSPRDGERK